MSDAPAAAGKSAPEPGQPPIKRLGKYEIQRMLGKGGMGAVYLAQDTLLNRLVALKVLPRDKAKNPTLVKRFHAEARSAAAMRHDNIVMLYENGEVDGYNYIALEFVDGTDAARLVSTRGILPVRRSTEIIKQVAQALDHAQQQGVVHRDIKPANLLIRRDGLVKLADMGLARIVDETLDTGITRAGTTVGTVDYMSPEQARDSKAADLRSDIYSLGCTWYFLLTGEPPFPDGALTNKLRAHAEKPCPDPRLKNNKVPETVVAIINRMTAKQPKDRYQAVRDLLADLERGSEVRHNVTRAILDDESSSEIVVGGAAKFASTGGLMLDESDHEIEVVPEAKSSSKSKSPPRRAVPEEEDEDDTPAPPPRKRSRSEPAAPEPDDDEPPPSSRRKGRTLPVPTNPVPVDDEEEAPASPRTKRKPAAESPHEFESDVTPERGQRLAQLVDVDLYADEDEPVTRRKPQPEPEPEAPVEKSKRKASRTAEPEAVEETLVPAKRKKKRRAPEPGESSSSGGKSASALLGGLSLDPEKLRAVGFYAAIASLAICLVVGVGYIVLRMNGGGGDSHVVVGPFGEGGQQPGAIALPGQEPELPEEQKADETLTAKSKSLNDLPKSKPAVKLASGEGDEWKADDLPVWPGDPLPISNLPILNVEHQPGPEHSFTLLNPHLAKLGKTGGVVRLRGRGPFALRPIDLRERGPLYLLGEKADAPALIVALPSENHSSADPVTMIRTAAWTAFRNLDVVVNPSLFNESRSVDWSNVTGAGADVRNCAFSLCGPASDDRPVTVLRVEGLGSGSTSAAPKGLSKDSPDTRVVVDRCLARGDALTFLDLQVAKVDTIVRNSCIWGGAGALLKLAGTAPDDNPDPLRWLRIRRSTLGAGRGAVIRFEQAENSRVVPTSFDVAGSLLAATGEDSGRLVDCSNWDAAQFRGALGRTLKWSQRKTLVRGFPTLIAPPAGDQVPAAITPEEWRDRWRDESPLSPDTFAATPWPAVPAARASEFHAGGLQLPSTEEGYVVGHQVDERDFAEASLSDRVAREAAKPMLPPWLAHPGEPPRTIEIDLSKDDLAKTLAQPDLPPGTLLIARGAGTQSWPIGPVTVRRNWLRVRFETPDGRLTTLVPRGVDDAWFSVYDGGLELSQVALVPPPGEKASVPKTYVRGLGSDIVLRSCRLQAPLASSSRNVALMESQPGAAAKPETGAPPPTRPESAGSDGPSRTLLITDSYLASFAGVLESDLQDTACYVRNSVLVSRGDVVTLAVRPGARSGLWDCRASTLSGCGSLFKIEGQPGAVPAPSPHIIRNERTVFAPPLLRATTGKPAATVLTVNGPVLTERQVAWFEERCGYAPEWGNAMLREGSAKDPLGWPEWENAWGGERLVDSLRAPADVILAGDLSTADRAKLEPHAFLLARACKAAQWAEGSAIGANITGLKVQIGQPGLFPGYRPASTKEGRPVGL